MFPRPKQSYSNCKQQTRKQRREDEKKETKALEKMFKGFTEWTKDSLTKSTTEGALSKIGVKVDGEYRQLRASQLQIENEFYSSIRPKRVARSGERPTSALRRGGVEYVEVRSLDLNAFDPVGMNQNAMRFTEAFLIYCLLHDSPRIDDAQYIEVQHNHSLTATQGRDPGLRLVNDGVEIGLRDWAADIVSDVRAIAELIDRLFDDSIKSEPAATEPDTGNDKASHKNCADRGSQSEEQRACRFAGQAAKARRGALRRHVAGDERQRTFG